MKTKLTVVLVAMSCIGTARAAEKIRYEEIPDRIAPFGSYIAWRSVTVTTVDGVKHSGQELILQPDHLRVVRRDQRGEDLPSDAVARIEIRQRGRFLIRAELALLLPLIIPAVGCGDSYHVVICRVISGVIFSPLWVTVSAAPFFLAAEAAAFFIPPKVYEIVH